ncbi:MAG: hypothetical protein NC253_15425 [Ruminococcus sp.]|nr:hypothetical protein [Ruminococcus sp.]MCM1382047.1 hypothetical protein [Muribaculaceae bacterium]
MKNDNISFTPTDQLTMKKYWHVAYLAGAIVIPVAVLVITLVRGTFKPLTIPVLLVIAGIILVLDYTNVKNKVVWNDEKIAFLQAFAKPKEYIWENLSAIYSGGEEMRLEFDDGKKLYIALKYDGTDRFIEKAEEVYNGKFGSSEE